MDELRISSTDGETLILESQDGTKHSLQIDDSLRTAIRGTAFNASQQVSLNPRQIQAEIRGGASVDELVSRSGDPRDYIEKFAQPVLDELNHVLSSALGVRISVAGDRYNEVSHTEFGEIISSRLSASNVAGHSWSTYRDENHSWRIVVAYNLAGVEQQGIWSFDLKKLLLSPENENAIALSTQNQLVAPPKLKPVVEPVAASDVDIAITDTAALPETQKLESVIPIGRSADRVQTEKPASEPVAESKDLLNALKKKREERAAETMATQAIEIVSVASVSDESEARSVDDEPSPAPAPIRRNGRPSIPSFDEIVQGTKSEDE